MSAIFFLKNYSHSSSHLVSKWLNCAEDRLATVESGTAQAPPSTWVGVRYACQGQLPFWSTPYSSLQSLKKLIPCLYWYDLAKSLAHEASHGWKLDWSRTRQGPHSSPGSPQAPYKCSNIISHKGTDQTQSFCLLSTMYFKSIPSIRYLSPVMRDGSNCTLFNSSPAGNVLQDAVSFWGIKANPGKATRQTTCPVMFTE